VASSVCFHIASNNGLGKKMAKVPLDDLNLYYKVSTRSTVYLQDQTNHLA
jgi:hypothetical protein